MAKNNYHFIPKKYTQQLYYRNVFENCNAFFRADKGKVFIIQAKVSCLVSSCATTSRR